MVGHGGFQVGSRRRLTVKDGGPPFVNISLFEVDLQKPRNLNEHESEECEDGEGVGVYPTLLESDKLQTYGRAKSVGRPGGVWAPKKTEGPECQ